MAKHIDSASKEAILSEIKNGVAVSEVCAKFGVGRNAVYRWIQQQADNTGTSSLEVAKLRRENQELKEIIGAFALDKKRAEKNQHRSQ
jgi:transposase-like protein